MKDRSIGANIKGFVALIIGGESLTLGIVGFVPAFGLIAVISALVGLVFTLIAYAKGQRFRHLALLLNLLAIVAVALWVCLLVGLIQAADAYDY